MSNFSNVQIQNGFLTKHLNNFSEMFEFVRYFNDSPGIYYFRGQSNSSWGLATTLQRFESQLNDFSKGTDQELLRSFKRLLRGKGLLKEMNSFSDEDYFCLGQHYGLPTPMLDWSESLYIALFFAFADEIPDEVENIAVWAIQTSAEEVFKKINKKLDEISSFTKTEIPIRIKFVDPFTDVNNRLISQSGILLQKPSQVDLPEMITHFCKGNSNYPVLCKLTMPVKERENVINALFSMNINWSTIYPGIDGAAKHAKMKLQMLDMKVRRMGKDGALAHSQNNILSPDA